MPPFSTPLPQRNAAFDPTTVSRGRSSQSIFDGDVAASTIGAAGRLFEMGLGTADLLFEESARRQTEERIQGLQDAEMDRLRGNIDTELGSPDVVLSGQEILGDDSGKGLSVNVPGALIDEVNRLDALKDAKEQGKRSATQFITQVDATARSLRSRFPGHKDVIDREISRITGIGNTANAARRALMSEQAALATAGTADEKRRQSFLDKWVEVVPVELYDRPLNVLRAYVRADTQSKSKLEDLKERRELANMNDNDLRGNGRQVLATVADELFRKSLFAVNKEGDIDTFLANLREKVQSGDAEEINRVVGLMDRTLVTHRQALLQTARNTVINTETDETILDLFTKQEGGTKKLNEFIDEKLVALQDLRDLVAAKDFAGAEIQANVNKYINEVNESELTRAMGPLQRLAATMAKTHGRDAVEVFLMQPAFRVEYGKEIKATVDAWLQAAAMDPSKVPGMDEFSRLLNTHESKDGTTKKALQNLPRVLTKQLTDAMGSEKVPVTLKKNIATFLTSKKQMDFVRKLTPEGRRQYLDHIGTAAMAESIKKNTPELMEAHTRTVEDITKLLTLSSADSVRQGGNTVMGIRLNPRTNRMESFSKQGERSSSPNATVSGSIIAGILNETANIASVLQRGSFEDDINQVNKGLDRMVAIAKVYEPDVSEADVVKRFLIQAKLDNIGSKEQTMFGSLADMVVDESLTGLDAKASKFITDKTNQLADFLAKPFIDIGQNIASRFPSGPTVNAASQLDAAREEVIERERTDGRVSDPVEETQETPQETPQETFDRRRADVEENVSGFLTYLDNNVRIERMPFTEAMTKAGDFFDRNIQVEGMPLSEAVKTGGEKVKEGLNAVKKYLMESPVLAEELSAFPAVTNFGGRGQTQKSMRDSVEAQSFSREELLEIIDSVADDSGLDPSTLRVLAASESSINAAAKAKGSSAAGVFQVIDQTWLDTLAKHGKKLFGIKIPRPNEKETSLSKRYPSLSPADLDTLLALRYLPRVNALVASASLSDDNAAIQKSIGRPTEPHEQMMMHVLGRGSALKVLRAPMDKPLTSVLSDKVISNNALPRGTVQDLHNHLKERMERKKTEFGL